MLEKYFANTEIANELGIPHDAVRDVLADNWDWQKVDVDRLLDALARKLKAE